MALRFVNLSPFLLILLLCASCAEKLYLPIAAKQAQPPTLSTTATPPSTPTITTNEFTQVPLVENPIAVTQDATLAAPTGQLLHLPLLAKSGKMTHPNWQIAPQVTQGSKEEGRFSLRLVYPLITAQSSDQKDLPAGLMEPIQMWINSQTNRFIDLVQKAPASVRVGFIKTTYFVLSYPGWDTNMIDPNFNKAPDTFNAQDVIFNGGNSILSILLISSNFIGGAQPYQEHYVINYDFDRGGQIQLEDLFQPGTDYLAMIAEACELELHQRRALDPRDIEIGAAPLIENYDIWNITPEGLLITFEEEQVGPDEVGPQQVLIPYNKLSRIIRPDGQLGNFYHAEP